MKNRSIRKKILKIITWVLVVPITLLLVINIPIITLFKNTNDQYYGYWMSETIDEDARVIDIAMLGAHDVFSADINLFSRVDELSADSIMMGVTGVLVKGFIVKQSVTQVSDVESLLLSGVRYLDIRLTYDDGEWYTKHNYISNNFVEQVPMITSFLNTHPGEFLILDFQHIHGLSYESCMDYNEFLDMLDETGILEYAYQVDSLTDLTYGELTNDKTEAKVIIISKFTNSSEKVLFYDDAIRSNWANSDDFTYIVNYLQEEATAVTEGNVDDRFRVMQGVATMQMSGSGIIKALGSWSLINRAKSFNEYLINSEDFASMIEELPIIMVDYSDTESAEFNTQIMEIILDFNRNS